MALVPVDAILGKASADISRSVGSCMTRPSFVPLLGPSRDSAVVSEAGAITAAFSGYSLTYLKEKRLLYSSICNKKGVC